MKKKAEAESEFQEFDKVMDGLLSVPYSELQRKLEEEKQEKAKAEREAAYFFDRLPRFLIPKEASCLAR